MTRVRGTSEEALLTKVTVHSAGVTPDASHGSVPDASSAFVTSC